MTRQLSDIMRCDHCGEVIGVYEPVVVVADGETLQTSCAADPELVSRELDQRYHRACYLGRTDS